MSNRISSAAIEQLRAKINGKIQEITKTWKVDEGKVYEEVLKRKGLGALAARYDKAVEEAEKAQKKQSDVLEELRKKMGAGSIYYGKGNARNLISGTGTLASDFEAARREQQAKQPGFDQVQRLRELGKNLNLKLELATSSKELKEAIAEILKEVDGQ